MHSVFGLRPPACARLPGPTVRWRLDNGLSVVLQRDSRVPLVDVHTAYLVGAAHDPPGLSGLAHLCEHLAARGPAEATGRPPPTRPLMDARTHLDRTSFSQTRPVRQLAGALRTEASRMARTEPSPSLLESERRVVLRELEEGRSHGPSSPPLELLCSALFPPSHPYRRSPAGSVEGIRSIRGRDAREFLGHYRPGLAVVALVGDLRPEAAADAVGQAFGELPAAPDGAAAPGPIAAPGAAPGGRLAVSSPSCRVYFACRAPGYGSPGRTAVDLAARCLAVGRRSPLARRLIDERRVARQVWAQLASLRAASLLAFAADGASGVPAQRLEQEMGAALRELAVGGISERRLEQSRRKALTDLYARCQRPVVRAEEIACATAFLDDPDYPAGEASRVATVGLAEVEAVLGWLRRPEHLAALTLGPEVAG